MCEDDFTLSMPLPEDILKRKYAGDLKGALAAIDKRLKADLPTALADRLKLEKDILLRLPTQYPYHKEQALQKMRETLPTFTAEELDEMDLDGQVDWIYLNGEKRYFVRFHKTLLRSPALLKRAGETLSSQSEWLDPLIERIRTQGHLTAHIKLKAELYVTDEAFEVGETYRAHLPIPAAAPQVKDIQIEFPGFTPKAIGPLTALQRTAYFEEKLEHNMSFTAAYGFTQTVNYADLEKPAPSQPLYPDAPPPCQDDLSEEGSAIRFTPYLKALCAEVTQDADSPLKKVKAIYDFITTRVTYAYVRDYFQIENLCQYAAVNLRGDCGIQALLFINLCRIAGIPARWQSGQVISKDYIGSHDWAQFYLPEWGWLFADCSFGGGAYRVGNEARRQFYLGNLEPLRIVYNRACQKALTPAKHFIRIDPYDNQTGEIESGHKSFNGRETDCDMTLVSLGYD